jgi:hypothetical protein
MTPRLPDVAEITAKSVSSHAAETFAEIRINGIRVVPSSNA